jgi:diaminopimelate epimerase
MINFSKMHGCGNDYIYIDCFHNDIRDIKDFKSFVRKVSDRHFGIGSDGVILICPSDVADVKMAMFNADGSEGAMCGNGIRCVGKYTYDKGICRKTNLSVETKSGIKYLELFIKNEEVDTVSVDMGIPSLIPSEIPVLTDKKMFQEDIMIDSKSYFTTCVSMGNPHAVIFLDEIESLDLDTIGPKFENHPLFPDRINTEFVKVVDDSTAYFRVFERGSGETFACGTGACAAVVAGCINGYFKRDCETHIILKGGDLFITYKSDGHVIMRGAATFVFDGKIKKDF